MDISDWRKQIDSMEDQLLDLLNQRARAAIAIGHLKRARKLPIHDPTRENEILARVVAKNPGPLPSVSMEKIFRTIIEETRFTEDNFSCNSPSPEKS